MNGSWQLYTSFIWPVQANALLIDLVKFYKMTVQENPSITKVFLTCHTQNDTEESLFDDFYMSKK